MSWVADQGVDEQMLRELFTKLQNSEDSFDKQVRVVQEQADALCNKVSHGYSALEERVKSLEARSDCSAAMSQFSLELE
eukprot:459410-Amphidinium_carterae.1